MAASCAAILSRSLSSPRSGARATPEAINSQAVRIVVQFIDARPARLHERFTLLALEALTAAWPCKK
jgi:hypothetical protein